MTRTIPLPSRLLAVGAGQQDRPRSNHPGPGTPTSPRPPRRRLLPYVAALAIFAVLFFGPGLISAARTEQLSYSTFLSDVAHHQVHSVEVGSNGAIQGKLESGKQFVTQAPEWALTTDQLGAELKKAGVQVGAYEQGDTLQQMITSLLPTLVFLSVLLWLGQRAQNTLASESGGLGGLFRNKARVTEAERPRTRFGDVAGYGAAKDEVREVVDFLQHPDRYQQAGARGPRGVLMVGPPGTGKTLLARAVAGEAQVPFYAVTGSSFVEMFVGLGASRVRDLFADARRNSPAIIFIDEIDAIGGRRGGGAFAGHDEREQTLNQLLSEMDGFNETSSVVVLANTNRPEILDPALLRPGRFDRQVQVPLPVLSDRQLILRVHTESKRLTPEVDLNAVARGTPGFSGADLANLVNEAALRAARAQREELQPEDFDEARERLILGQPDGNALLPEERLRVSVHEAGHALVAALSPTADPVSKITILPAGMSLGATHQLPNEERRLYTEDYLYDSLAVRMAGRAAELAVFGQSSTGAAQDLAEATRLAVRMVREYGFSSRFGPVAYPPVGSRDVEGAIERPYAENSQHIVDAEVARLLRDAEERAIELLHDHRPALDQLSKQLLTEETVDGSAVYDILRNERNPVA